MPGSPRPRFDILPLCVHTLLPSPPPAHPRIIHIRHSDKEQALRTCSSMRVLQFPEHAGAARCGVRLEKQFVLC